MAGVDTIVNVSITTATKTVSRVGFGTPMLLAYHTRWLDTHRIYSKSGYPTNMTDDGFTTADAAYQMAGAVFSQTPSPSQVVVGRRLAAFTQTVEITPTVKGEGFVHSITVKELDGTSTTITVTEGAASSVAALCTAWETAINATSVAITASDNITEVSIAADNAGDLFGYVDISTGTTFQDVTTDAGVATDLASVLSGTTDFYGVALDSSAPAENQALAAAIQAQKLIFVASDADDANGDAGSTTDTSYVVNDNSYDRTAVFYHDNPLDFLGAALLGRCLPAQPGFITWAFKALSGVSADTVSDTFLTNIRAKRGNVYISIGGNAITYEGYTGGSGNYLDITRVKDWAEARVKEEVFGALINADKIPFTDQGGSVLKGLVLAALNRGVAPGDVGAFAEDPAPSCIVPPVADISAANKGARYFSGITFNAVLTGAVHRVGINGTLSLA